MNILQKRWEEFGPGKVKGLKFKSLQDDGFPTQLKHLGTVKHAINKGKYPFDSLQNKAMQTVISQNWNKEEAYLIFDTTEFCANKIHSASKVFI